MIPIVQAVSGTIESTTLKGLSMEEKAKQQIIIAVKDSEGKIEFFGFNDQESAMKFAQVCRKEGYEAIIGVPVEQLNKED